MSKLLRQWANADTDLFGNPLPKPPDVKTTRLEAFDAESPSSAPQAPAAVGGDSADLADFNEDPEGSVLDDIESFKKLECEVRFRTKEHGDIYLVPKHTDKDRLELTPEDVWTIRKIVETFDAKIVAFRRLDDRDRKQFTCEHYYPEADGKRCVFYIDNGACARGDEFMCVEWQKANDKKGVSQ
ncbi:MAG: hypothetical protein GX444_17000 [Myxococcales bacterium]|nr:hypothetical protein [Myxococcales bacterium]